MVSSFSSNSLNDCVSEATQGLFKPNVFHELSFSHKSPNSDVDCYLDVHSVFLNALSIIFDGGIFASFKISNGAMGDGRNIYTREVPVQITQF